MTDVKGAFSLIQSPQALPGKCAGCGKATCAEGFIDTGFQADFYGAVIYCYECVLDMATKFGLISPDAANYLRNRADELEAEIIIQREAILGLENTIDGLLATRVAYSSSDSKSESVVQPETAELSSVTPEVPERDFVVEGADSLITDGESEVSESSSEQESVGVSSDLADSASIGLDV